MKMATNLPSNPTTTARLLIIFLCIFINQKSSSAARNLGGSLHHHHNHNHSHHKITFFMHDVLNFNASHPSPKTNHHLPFPKPLGLFPPNGGIPISESDPSLAPPATGTQTLDVSNVGIFFPARATLQELEFGTLVIIDEDLFEHYSLHGSPTRLGKAQGIYVASSEDGTSHMMAMTASFSDTGGIKDGLRFFGVHRKDGTESHIAVIGGTGKYNGANGYATVKARVHPGSNKVGGQEPEEANSKKFLLFNVYLS